MIEEFSEEFIQRIENRVNNLQTLKDLPLEERIKTITKALQNSIIGEKIISNPDLIPEDIMTMSLWYNELIENQEKCIEIMRKVITDDKDFKQKYLESFSPILISLLRKIVENQETTPEKKKEIFSKTCEEFGIRKIEFLYGLPSCTIVNALATNLGLLPNPSTTALADFVAQCAEDNAGICLINELDNFSFRSITVEWFAAWKPKKEIEIKPLCFFCKIRFGARLTELIDKKRTREESL